MGNLKLQSFKALLDAFPARGKLVALLGQRFGVNYATLTEPDTLDVEYWNLVTQVAAEGWLAELARAVWETLPRNPMVSRLVIDFGLTSAAGLTGAADPAGEPPDRRLERMVREQGWLTDLPAFLARLSRLEGQVCRIENGPADPLGTGFLVGSDLVMTNAHVVQALAGGAAPALACRFDYLSDPSGVEVRGGVVEPLASDWLVASRPHDPGDTMLDPPPPDPANLDFALLRLARGAGNLPRRGEETPDNPPRGWIAADPGRRPLAGEDIYILQHPLGAPLKLARGRIGALPFGGLRLRYDATTEPGSSGAPVLAHDLTLVALHHVGDPNHFRTAAFNQAIPMGDILGWLQGKVAPFWEVPAP